MSVYGEIFGFVFLDPSLSVVSIRSNVTKELQEIHSFKSIQNNFFFCDRNGWPVNGEQEYHLTGWDLIQDHMIKIRPFKIDTRALSEPDLNTGVKRRIHNRNGSTVTLPEYTNHVDGSMTISNNSNHSEEDRHNHMIEDQPSSSNANSRHTCSNSNHHHHPHYYNGNNSSDVLTNNSLNDSFYRQHNNLISDQTLVKSQSTRPKPILISYVRKEAEQHARNLKTQLTMLGCDVYLDVDEITVGDDWQDALSKFALFFVDVF